MKQRAPVPSSALLTHVQQALGVSQRELGELLGVSRSTVARWNGSSLESLLPSQLDALVRALYPVEESLARQIAVAHGATLESLGVVAPVAAAVAPPVVTAAPAAVHPLMVDTVVCAAAEVAGLAPAAVRPLLVAAFERARVVGLSVEEVVRGLGGGAAAGKASK